MNLFTSPVTLPDQLELIGRIGKGGAGSLFLVRDITGRILALKIVNSRWQEKEFSALTELRNLPVHSALIQVFQVGTLPDGKLFYTMELADNIADNPDSDYVPDTLSRRINMNQLPFDQILNLFIEIAEGAKHLHEHGLFHGDIKPENIIFVNGKPKLADFGTLSSEGNSGTAGFMAEHPKSVSDRDCYALSKTLYCAWSRRDVSEYPMLPEAFDGRELRLIRSVYHKGCNPVPEKRFGSTEEFIAVLKKLSVRRERNFPVAGVLICGILVLTVIPAVFFFLKPEKSQTDGSIPAQKKTSPLPKVKNSNRPEIAMMEITLRAGSEFSGDIRGGLDYRFRPYFESLNSSDFKKSDEEHVKWFQTFYKDCDRLESLRKELLAEEDPEKRLALFRTSGFDDLYTSLHRRSMEFDHKFILTVRDLHHRKFLEK